MDGLKYKPLKEMGGVRVLVLAADKVWLVHEHVEGAPL